MQTGTFPGSNPPSDVPVFNSSPSGAGAASAGSTPNPATGTSTDNPATANTAGGVGGTPGEAVARQSNDQRCRDVLAHKDYFTANVIEACQQQAWASGQNPGQATDQRDLPTGSIGAGIAPVDKPSEVQKAKEPSDQKSLNGVCSNC
jgi:hypothetical protein